MKFKKVLGFLLMIPALAAVGMIIFMFFNALFKGNYDVVKGLLMSISAGLIVMGMCFIGVEFLFETPKEK